MQFEVPQFSDVQNKVIGPFTLRQFLYLAAAGTIAYIFYRTLTGFLFITLSIPIVGLGAAMAFLKINGLPFEQLLLRVFKFTFRPKFYTWQKENPANKKVKYDASEEDEE